MTDPHSFFGALCALRNEPQLAMGFVQTESILYLVTLGQVQCLTRHSALFTFTASSLCPQRRHHLQYSAIVFSILIQVVEPCTCVTKLCTRKRSSSFRYMLVAQNSALCYDTNAGRLSQ